MEDLRGLNTRGLFAILDLPDETFVEWLKERGLLWKQRMCCDKAMNPLPKSGGNHPRYRCTRCKKERGFLVDTWFEGSHLSLKEIFQLSYYWSRQTHAIREIQFEMRRPDGSTPNEHTLVDWANFFRDMAAFYFEMNPTTIGGRGRTVEIDETVITKRKYDRGILRAEQQWFFGGVERESGECFLVPVDRRDASTLLPILQKHVLPGSVVISDKWAAYGGIERLPEGYWHFTVNHSDREHPFVDQTTGAHTNGIEGTWSQFKKRHKQQNGIARSLLHSYTSQFLWRKKFGGNDALYHLWTQIAAKYPLS